MKYLTESDLLEDCCSATGCLNSSFLSLSQLNNVSVHGVDDNSNLGHSHCSNDVDGAGEFKVKDGIDVMFFHRVIERLLD